MRILKVSILIPVSITMIIVGIYILFQADNTLNGGYIKELILNGQLRPEQVDQHIRFANAMKWSGAILALTGIAILFYTGKVKIILRKPSAIKKG